MPIESIHSDKAPLASGPYSQAVKAGNIIMTSGQIPVVPETGAIPETIEEQTRTALSNLIAILEAAGAKKEDVVSTRIFLSDMSNFAVVNFIYMEFFGEPYPARSCVEVSSLPKGVMLMVDAMAVLS